MNNKYWIKIIFFNVLVFIAAIAVLETALHLNSKLDFEQKKAEIFRPWRMPLNQIDDIENPVFCAMVSHPFFGYTLNPNFGSNNMGFDDGESFPFTKLKDEYYVGLFGGSVMQSVARQLRAYNNSDRITVKICGTEKKIHFVNYSLGGYRQPQQYNVFHLFSDQIDMSVNLDGYNEVLLSPSVSYPPFYPTFVRHLFFLNNSKLTALFKDFAAKKTEFFLLKFVQRNEFLLRSEVVFFTFSNLINYLDERSNQFNKSDYHEIPERPRPAIDRTDELAEIWVRYTFDQYQLSKLKRINSIFIVQPTQYLPDAKQFTPEEKAIAFVADEKEVKYRGEILAKLVEKAEKLKKSGLPIFNFTRIFANEIRPVFIDNMCHLNGLGNEILAKKMLEIIRVAVAKSKCP